MGQTLSAQLQSALKDAESLLAFCSVPSVLGDQGVLFNSTFFFQRRLSPELKVKLKIALMRTETLITL